MIIEGPHFGWDAKAVTAAVAAGAGLVAFVLWELRHPRPVLDVRRFTGRRFAGSNLAVALFFLAVFGAFYYLTQHLQFVLRFDPLETGLRMLPLAGAVFAGSALTGWLTPLVVLGLAIGLALAPCTDAIMGAFPESELGVGGAVNDTSLELAARSASPSSAPCCPPRTATVSPTPPAAPTCRRTRWPPPRTRSAPGTPSPRASATGRGSSPSRRHTPATRSGPRSSTRRPADSPRAHGRWPTPSVPPSRTRWPAPASSAR